MFEMVDMCSAWDRRRCLNAVAGLLVLFALLGLAASSGARADEASGVFVDLPNVKLWVTDTGGTGDPVILPHANTGTSENWQKQNPALVQAGYRVIAFGLRRYPLLRKPAAIPLMVRWMPWTTRSSVSPARWRLRSSICT
jgi:hypothetical protein